MLAASYRTNDRPRLSHSSDRRATPELRSVIIELKRRVADHLQFYEKFRLIGSFRGDLFHRNWRSVSLLALAFATKLLERCA